MWTNGGTRSRNVKISLVVGLIMYLIATYILFSPAETSDEPLNGKDTATSANTALAILKRLTFMSELETTINRFWQDKSEVAVMQDENAMEAAMKPEDDAVSQTPISSPPKVRVFDFLMMNDELDMLEIRLHEVYDVVEMFVILESDIAFSGKLKPLHYQINKDRFKRFHDKIIHLILPPMTDAFIEQFPVTHPNIAAQWRYEYFSRDKGLQLALEAIQPNEGDWVIVGELDEILKRSFIESIKAPDLSTVEGQMLTPGNEHSGGDIIRASCDFYIYSYEFFNLSSLKYGPMAFRYRVPDSPILSNDSYPGVEDYKWFMENNHQSAGERLRDARNYGKIGMPIDRACTHCSWCFANITMMISKVDSWGHQELNKPEVKERAFILEHTKTGLDLWERGFQQTTYIPDNQDLPLFILQNRDRFSYMINRKDLPNAGFIDVNPEDPLGPLVT